MIPALPDLMVEPVVRAALLEDLGRAGDLTTDAIVPATANRRARLVKVRMAASTVTYCGEMATAVSSRRMASSRGLCTTSH